jgi:thiosulfate/3-mercaptopyruvate sulfurtransferase
VSVDWLPEELKRADNLRVVDVRWKLGDPGAGERAYRAGHIPGAVFADIDRDLAAPPGDRGRHPLPVASDFEALMGRLGIGDATRVVAYDDQGGAYAARLWFLLRYFGHETGAVLDGGLPAWVAAGHRLETAVPEPPRAEFHAVARPEMLLPREEVLPAIGNGVLLLDARAPERYRGETEPVDPRPGHIPGAINAPFAGNLSDGKFLPAEALAERYRKLGVNEGRTTAAYCGSGVTATHDLLALELAGISDVLLYPGSWSEWSRDPSAPIETGDRLPLPVKGAGGLPPPRSGGG